MLTETAERPNHSPLLKGIAGRLESQYGDHFTRDTLEHYVNDSYERLAAESRIVTHVPAFVERFARQRLRALTKLAGRIENHPPEVLFVCERNDASAQVAAALFTAGAGDRAHAQAAGEMPEPHLLADAVAALHERGIDLDDRPPVLLTEEIEQAADVVVTLDAHDDVPIVDDTRFYAWRTAPNHAEGLAGYRAWLDDLADRVRQLVAEVVPPNPRRRFDRELDALGARVETGAAAVLDAVTNVLAAPTGAAGRPGVDDVTRAAHRDVEAASVELITRQQPVADDLRRIIVLNRTSEHLASLGDSVGRIRRLLTDDAITDDPAVVAGLDRMAATVTAMTRRAVEAAVGVGHDRAPAVAALGRDLEEQYATVFDALVGARADDSSRPLLVAARVARELQRIGEHAVGIAEQAWYRATGERDLPAPEADGDAQASGS
ncbi:MAG: PhoU domain-containing protein [Actinomycetota bacterium]|nr:PhoU domain-containing protein [Actinomycetota bacterium]